VGLEERMVKVNVYIRRKRANVGDGIVPSFGWVAELGGFSSALLMEVLKTKEKKIYHKR
jgi:hypothetical protein